MEPQDVYEKADLSRGRESRTREVGESIVDLTDDLFCWHEAHGDEPLLLKPGEPCPEHGWEFADPKMRCAKCGAIDQIDMQSMPSHGGTTEGWERCDACGATHSWADLSAVI